MTADYLYDTTAPPDDEVTRIEQVLSPLRFDPAAHPLAIGRRPQRLRWLLATAAMFAVAVAALAMFYSWRLNWPSGEAWSMHLGRSGAQAATLPIARQVSLSEPASVDIARLGRMQLAAGTTVTLEETGSRRHRVALDRGNASVRVWAPPGRFALQTPAGSVIDLGCVFSVAVDGDGTTRVSVSTGWVQLSNTRGESLVPAGAASAMTTTARPRVPVYRDASGRFAAAVRAFEADPFDPRRAADLRASLPDARARDAVTLLDLANVSRPDVKRPLFERAAQLVPPPAGVSIDALVGGDRDQFWRWYDALDLPPVKSWWRNWRDVLPW